MVRKSICKGFILLGTFQVKINAHNFSDSERGDIKVVDTVFLESN